MARKPLDQLSPAYRKRIERAESKGKTRQQARGHKEKEHVVRREREVSRGGLTSDQKQQVRKFATEQAERDKNADVTDLKNEMLNWVTKHGFERFKQIRAERNRLRKLYQQHRYSQLHGKGNLKAFTDDINSQFKMSDPPPIQWIFYK